MTAPPSSFHCVNWADQRDNFVNGLLHQRTNRLGRLVERIQGPD
jgi:hypothetical protein